MQIDEKLIYLKDFAKLNNIPIVRDYTGTKLQETVAKCNPSKILEVGTAIGYSALLMISKCPCAQLTTIEKDVDRYNIAHQTFQDCNIDVNLICGDAYEVLQNLKDKGEKFDFVFLDGPKGYYYRYLNIIKDMLEDNACIFADNVGFFGMVKSGIYPHRHKTIVTSLQNYLKDVNKAPFDSIIDLDSDDGFAITYYNKGE